MPFPNIGPGELILILIIALVVLGPGKLPDVAASLGKGLREFRKAASDVTDAGKIDTPAPPASVAQAQAAALAESPAAATPVAAAPTAPAPNPPATDEPEPTRSDEPASDSDRA
jgi:sec-independent protein translocase protein TatA